MEPWSVATCVNICTGISMNENKVSCLSAMSVHTQRLRYLIFISRGYDIFKTSALIWLLVLCQPGDKPFSKPKTRKLLDVYHCMTCVQDEVIARKFFLYLCPLWGESTVWIKIIISWIIYDIWVQYLYYLFIYLYYSTWFCMAYWLTL